MAIDLSGMPDQEEQPEAPSGGEAAGPKPLKVDLSQMPDQVTEAEDAFKAASAENPDRAAQVLQISNKLGTDPQHVDKNFDEAKRAAASPGQDYWLSLKDRNPGVYDWFANRSNMALAHDDIGALEYLSQTLESGTAGWELGNAQGRLGDEGKRAMDEASQIGFLSEPTKTRLADVQKRVDDASKRSEKFKEGYIFSAAQVLPFMTRPFISGGAGGETEIGKASAGLVGGAAAGAAIGAMGGPIGMAIGAGVGVAGMNWRASADVEGGLAFVDYVRDGIDPAKAEPVARMVGEINGALEGVSDVVLGKIAGKLAGRVGVKMIPASALALIAKVPGGAKIAEIIEASPSVFAGMSLSQAIARAGKVMAKSVAVETSTEFVQEIPPQVGKANLEGKTIDPDMAGQIIVNAAQVIPQTLKAMTVLGGMGGAVHLALDVNDMKKAQATKEVVEALGDAAKKSKLLERAPEKLREFVETVTKDGPVKEVFISPKAIQTFFQKAGIDPEKGAAELGLTDALKEVEETGDRVAIPMGLFAEKIGANPDLIKLISEDVSFRADVPSVNEVKQSQAELQEFQQQLEQSLAELQGQTADAATPEAIYQKISTQLKSAGGKKKHALVASEFYRVLAQRMGQSPDAIWKSVMELQIIGVNDIRIPEAQQEGGALYQQQPDVSPLGFFSQVRREVSKMDFRTIPPKDLLGRIMKIQGIKKDELEQMGLVEYLEMQPEGKKLSKDEVLAFIEANGLQVSQVVLGEMPKPKREKKAARDNDAPVHVDDLSFEDGYVEPDDSEYDQEAEYYLDESEFFDDDIEEWKKGGLRDELREELMSDHTDADDNINEDSLEAAIDAEIKRLDDRGQLRDRAIEALGLERRAEELARESVNENNDRQYVEESETGYRLEWSNNYGTYDIYLNGTYVDDLPSGFQRNANGRNIIRDAPAAQSALTQWLAEEGHVTYDRQVREEDMQWREPTQNGRNYLISHLQAVDDVYIEQKPSGKFELTTHLGSSDLEADSFESAYAESIPILIEANVVIPRTTPAEEQKALPAPTEPEKPSINKPTGQSEYAQYSVTGATNYREILLTLPNLGGDTYHSPHFGRSRPENPVAHVRISDRVDAEGRKTLFVEELQSDWHQQGRERGYREDISEEDRKAYEEYKDTPFERLTDEQRAWMNSTGDRIAAQNEAVPDAPFKQTDAWAALAMKRVLRMAVEENYDAVAWTPAEVHVDRWGTDSVSWVKAKPQTKLVLGHDRVGKYFFALPEDQSHARPHESKTFDYSNDETKGLPGYAEAEASAMAYLEEQNISRTNPVGWLVGSVEQVGGNAGGMNIEEAARQRGQLLERRGERVTSKEELREVLRSTLHRERNDRSLDSLTESIWKQMQESDSGMKAPRKEGMELFYDNVLPKKVMPAILKKLDKDAKVTIGKLPGVDDRSGTGADQLAWEIPVTPKMKEEIGKGLPLFQQGKDQLAKGSFEVEGDKAIIRLAKIKDESTFFHEMGHLFMESLRRVATVPGAPRQIMDDYATVLDQLGENGEMTREAEEKFADAFLVYLYEGKTPNKKLQGVFDRFRQWVINTLRWLTSDEFAKSKGTKLSPELRGIFDRLLATDEEINAAKMTSGFVGIQDQGADLSVAQLSRLQELQRQAHALAFAQILNGQIRDLEAEGTEKYAATEAEQRRQAKEQLEVLPAFKAGKQIVKQLKSKQGAVQVMRDYLLGKKEKHWQTFETIAEVNGYPSADKMAEDIITSKDLDEAIEDEVKSRMSFDYHRKLIDREAIRAQAQDLLHNERTLEILALEQEFLNELLSDVDAQQQGQQEQTAEKKAKAAKKKESRADRAKVRAALRKGQLEYVRSRAKEIVAKLSTSRVAKLGPFYTVERRTAQALGKAIAQKKFEEAAKLKGQQMLNHAVASEAAKAKARVTKGLAQLEKIRKKDRDAFKKQEHFDQAAALLARMGFNHPAYSPEARQETLADWAKRMEESTNAVAIEGWLLDETLPLDPKALSVEKFQQALDAVKNIIRVANLEDRALTLMGKIDMNELLTKLEVAQVEGRKGRKTRVHRMQENRIQKWVEKARLFGLSNIRVQNLAQSIQGFEENGPWTEVWRDSVKAQADVESSMLTDYMKRIEGLYAPYSKAERYALGTRRIEIPEFGQAVTKSYLIALARNLGNAGNKLKLLSTPIVGLPDPASWTEEMLMTVLQRELDTRDWQFVQGSWDLIDTLWPEIVKLHSDVTGFAPGKIEAVPLVVQTKDGNTLALQGGYYPLRRDARASQDQAIKDDINSPTFTEGNSSWKAQTKTGHTISRVSAQYAVAIDEAILYEHITDVIHDLAFRRLVIDLVRLTSTPRFQGMVQQSYGMNGSRLFNGFVRSIAFQERLAPSSSAIEPTMAELRRSASVAFMVFNVANIVQNMGNAVLYGRAIEGFGHADAYRALGTLGAGHLKDLAANRAKFRELRDFVFEKSSFMRDKNARPDLTFGVIQKVGAKTRGVKREIVAQIAGEESAITRAADVAGVKLEDAIDFGRGLMAGTDELTSVPIWVSAYNKMLDEGKSEKEAIDFADRLIETAIGSGRRYDASPIMRDPSEIVKTFTMFMTWANTQLNRSYLELGRARLQGDPDQAMIARLVSNPRFMGYLASAMFAFPILSALLAFKGPDDDEDTAKWATKQILANPLSMMPAARDLTFMIDEALGTRGFSQRRTPPTGAALESLVQSWRTIRDDDATFAQMLESMTKAASFIGPMPNQFGNWFWNAYDIGRGAMDPKVSDVARRRPKKDR